MSCSCPASAVAPQHPRHFPVGLIRDWRGHLAGVQLDAPKPDLTVKLQIAPIGPLMAVNMIKHGGGGEVAVKGERPGNLLLDRL